MTVEQLFKEYPGLEGNVGIAQIQDYTSGRSAPPESARAKPAPVAAPKPEAKPPAAKPEGAPSVDRNVPALTGIKSLEDQMKEQERLMGPNTGNDELNAKIAKRLADMDKRASQDDRAAMRNAFIKFGTEASPGGIGVAALKGLGSYGDASEAAKKAREGMDLELTKMQADIKKGERAEKRGNLDGAAKAFESAENSRLKIAELENRIATAKIAASGANAASNLRREEKDAIKADLTKTLGREPTTTEVLSAYSKATSVADESSEGRLRVAANTAYEKWAAGILFDPEFRELQKKASNGDAAAVAKIEQLKAEKRKQINAEIMGTQTPVQSGGAKGAVDTNNSLLRQ